jgi:polyisoprenoid-binding protein YceI
MYHKKHLLIFIILTTLLLVACSSTQSAQQMEPTVVAEQPVQTEEIVDSNENQAMENNNDNEPMDDSTGNETMENNNENVDMEDDNDNEAMENENAETESDDDQTATSGGVTLFIVPEESEARFIIDEVLSGADKTVVGTTTAVEGTITADEDNPQNVSVSAVKVDLSTLTTDSSFRNRAIRDFILQTGDPANQFATFEPTRYEGLPESVTIGEPFTFQITGDLTIHGVTREETFEVTLTPVSETRIEGTATLSDINYGDFGVQILRLPEQVASVEDTVTLEFSFVAVAQ